MEKIASGYFIKNGPQLYYTILDNGFDIYGGNNAVDPILHQPEPYIPNPDISYTENAIEMCKELAERSNQDANASFTMTESMYSDMQSNIDYLMLLNDPDSASE